MPTHTENPGDACLRVLTWNLYHGRSLPPAGRSLQAEFSQRLAEWDWDVALLQEVPPWWPARLARAAGAQRRSALTSRNEGLALRRLLAERWPDLMKSNGGGANAILARRQIDEYRALRLRRWPERRVAQLARLAGGTCVANFHASSVPALAEDELRRLLALASRWSGSAPLVVGGDLNLRAPELIAGGLVHAAARDVDHVFARGLLAAGPALRLDRAVPLAGGCVELSDHIPLAVTLQRADSYRLTADIPVGS
ncbi:MAG TPA: endonuclease/exonuclease/phosphatase family protein [Solirubrobacteraceae bacterium]|nr:endonuclease/exonuclease/phosphatase family protein [Solirubrobacteraceae bacterium]